ncbi:unnamed protein product [Peniophora sp. CBMAI 1063]|nr:unnamed protein product [Peniophora sp. CBMAI 1063]
MCASHDSQTMSLADKARRRTSVDIGGLALALQNEGSGDGWIGGDEPPEKLDAVFAELLSRMYNDTQKAIQTGEASAQFDVDPDVRAQLIARVDAWDFEPHKLDDNHLIYSALLIFESLFLLDGLQEAVNVSLDQIQELLWSLRRVYREQNSYHNFQHAVDVLQAMHHMLLTVGRVPPAATLLHGDNIPWAPNPDTLDPLVECLDSLDLFCLYVASIGHDVAHPGLTNTFMQNAKSPLAELYEGKSPLENMHCTLLMKILRKQGFGRLLDTPNTKHSFRKLLHQTVLATDMRVHNVFMEGFRDLVNGKVTDDWAKRVLVSQALIKCADISNPCRPLGVSQHWAMALASEWTSQANLESYLNMPATLKPADGPLTEARSQVFFIDTFASPLFHLTAKGITPVSDYATKCVENYKVWNERAKTLSAQTVPDTADTESVTSLTSSQLPEDFLNAFPMTIPSSLLAAEHTERSSQSDWASTTGPGSVNSFNSSSRSASASPSPVRLPAQLPALSATSTSTASGSSEAPGSPPQSPAEPLSAGLNSLPGSATSSGGSPASLLALASAPGSSSTAIRTAFKNSVRKKPSFLNRNSWSPSPRQNPPATH